MVDWKNVFVPTVLVGLIAGLSVFLAQYNNGLKPAIISSLITFLITLLQELKKKWDEGKVSAKNGKPLKKSLRLFPGQE